MAYKNNPNKALYSDQSLVFVNVFLRRGIALIYVIATQLVCKLWSGCWNTDIVFREHTWSTVVPRIVDRNANPIITAPPSKPESIECAKKYDKRKWFMIYLNQHKFEW